MNSLAEFGLFIYTYCTDFIINLANISKLSYYEINFIVFCVLYPLLIVGSAVLFVIQRRRIRKLKAALAI